MKRIETTDRHTKKEPYALLTLFSCAIGISIAIIACIQFLGMFDSLIYQAVTIFLTLTLVSNFLAKALTTLLTSL